MHLIGVDIGSSFVKGAVLDTRLRSLPYVARQPFPEPRAGLPPGHFEFDPATVVLATERILHELLPHASDCAGIFFSGQMGGVILTDGAGEALSSGISWRDQRALESHPSGAGSYLEVARERVGASDCARLGHELNPGAATSLLFWLAEQRRLPCEAVPASIPGFVVQRLCGMACVGYTEAIGTLDLQTRDWHRCAFAKLALDRLAWPVLSDCSEPVGTCSHNGRRIPCYAAVGDHQCALLGALVQEGELSINVSTGSQVSLLTRQWRPGDYQSRSFFGDRFLNTITHLPAGRALNVLVDLLCELPAAEGRRPADPWTYIGQAAASSPDTDLAVDLAFFSGPMGERGSIANIGVENLSVGSLFRAAFRNMAANYEVGARRLSPDGEWRNLVFSGGLALKNSLLRQFVLERFSVPHRVCASDEDTLRGLLILGMVATGAAESLDAAIAALRRDDAP